MGSAASRGTPAHALTSSADTHAAAHLLHSRARRIYFFLAPMTCFGTAQKPSPGVHGLLARRVNPIRTRLTAALRDDCCFFAAVSHFAATPLASCREALLLLRRHQSRLEDDSGRERRQERQGHQLAHARRTRVMREPQAPE